jgi:hypothetical protein
VSITYPPFFYLVGSTPDSVSAYEKNSRSTPIGAVNERDAVGDKNEIVKPEKGLLVMGDIHGDRAAIIRKLSIRPETALHQDSLITTLEIFFRRSDGPSTEFLGP